MTKDSKLTIIKKYWQNSPELFSEKYKTNLSQLASPVNWFLLARRKKALQMSGNVDGKRILDVGCGSGVFMIEFIKKGAYVAGIDYSQKMIDLAKAELNTHKISEKKYQLKKAGATKLPYKKSEFDLILATGLTDYMTDEDDQQFLNEASRVLKKGGRIVVSFPVEKSPFAFVRSGLGLKLRQTLFKLPPIHNQFSAQKITRFFKIAGLKEISKNKIFETMWLVEATR